MNSENLSTKNYFNNFLNNKLVQTKSNNDLKQSTNKPLENTNSTNKVVKKTNDDSLLNNLSNVLAKTQNDSQEQDILYTINKLLSSGVSIDSIANLLTSLSQDKGDILYTRTSGEDPYITLQNKIKYIGGDLKAFLAQALKVSEKGFDINKYVNTVSKIVDKGDYDDLRRFIDVANQSLDCNYNIDDLSQYTSDVVDEDPENIEINMFSIQTLFEHGANLDDSIEILRNTDTADYTGKQNMTILDTLLVKAQESGEDMESMISNMAKSGDTIWFLNEWASQNNLKIIKPKLSNEKYKKIELIDKKKDLIIHQGDSVALFAKAISSKTGIMNDSVLNWSTVQKGAIPSANGSSYLDLSKLDKGCYDIFVKIANDGTEGTDTGKRRVIVIGKDEQIPAAQDEVKKSSKNKGKNYGNSKENIVITAKNSLHINFESSSGGYDFSTEIQIEGGSNTNTSKYELKNLKYDKKSEINHDNDKKELKKKIQEESELKYQKEKLLVNQLEQKDYEKKQDNYKEQADDYNNKKRLQQKEKFKII